MLSAVAISRRSDLDGLVRAMDYLNRAWPTADEFEWAVQNLLGMGLLEERPRSRLRLTKAGRHLWKHGRGRDIERFAHLKLPPLGPRREWSLDRDAFEQAVQRSSNSG